MCASAEKALLELDAHSGLKPHAGQGNILAFFYL